VAHAGQRAGLTCRLARHVSPLGWAIIVTVRRRSALRRWAGDRDWDRKAPDAPDEPPDWIWERARERREAERRP
jgi:hypothetical protein